MKEEIYSGILKNLNLKINKNIIGQVRKLFLIILLVLTKSYDRLNLKKEIMDIDKISTKTARERIDRYLPYLKLFDHNFVLFFKKETKKIDIDSIKEEIRKLSWENYSNEYWTFKIPFNQYLDKGMIYRLDPVKFCSELNPLYVHKEWLERIYNNHEWKLNDIIVGEICGVHPTTILKWRKRYNINRKVINENGKKKEYPYKKTIMPMDYFHPQINRLKNQGRISRFYHIIVMEKFLSESSPTEIWERFKISKKDLDENYLIDGKHLRLDCVVHHINFNKRDNLIKNLFPYENQKTHNEKAHNSLNKCFETLIKLNQIYFNDGKYYLNKEFDYRNLNYLKIKDILKPKSVNYYKNIENVKRDIKKIDWNKISKNWTVKRRINKHYVHSPLETIILNPKKDCCKEKNPLYMHKKWIKHLVIDKKFSLSDTRLAEVCGTKPHIIRFWRETKHNIKVKGKIIRGFGVYIDKNNRIWIKAPDDYENPVVKHDGFMLEYRYKIEQYIIDNPNSKLSPKFQSKGYLINGKFLKSECPVHHINFDTTDNRLENLWVCKNSVEHGSIEAFLYTFVNWLLMSKRISFRYGAYQLTNKINLTKRNNNF